MYKCICCEENEVENDVDECEYCSIAFGNDDEDDGEAVVK